MEEGFEPISKFSISCIVWYTHCISLQSITCLTNQFNLKQNKIRQYTYLDSYETPPEHFRGSPEMLRTHVDHCIESLRLATMCQGDVTPLFIRHDPSNPLGDVADFSNYHKCRRFDKLLDWMKGHSMPCDEKECWYRHDWGQMISNIILAINYLISLKMGRENAGSWIVLLYLVYATPLVLRTKTIMSQFSRKTISRSSRSLKILLLSL